MLVAVSNVNANHATFFSIIVAFSASFLIGFFVLGPLTTNPSVGSKIVAKVTAKFAISGPLASPATVKPIAIQPAMLWGVQDNPGSRASTLATFVQSVDTKDAYKEHRKHGQRSRLQFNLMYASPAQAHAARQSAPLDTGSNGRWYTVAIFAASILLTSFVFAIQSSRLRQHQANCATGACANGGEGATPVVSEHNVEAASRANILAMSSSTRSPSRLHAAIQMTHSSDLSSKASEDDRPKFDSHSAYPEMRDIPSELTQLPRVSTLLRRSFFQLVGFGVTASTSVLLGVQQSRLSSPTRGTDELALYSDDMGIAEQLRGLKSTNQLAPSRRKLEETWRSLRSTPPTREDMVMAFQKVQQVREAIARAEIFAREQRWAEVENTISTSLVLQFEEAATLLAASPMLDPEQRATIGWQWGACGSRHCGAQADAAQSFCKLRANLGMIVPLEALFYLDIAKRSVDEVVSVGVELGLGERPPASEYLPADTLDMFLVQDDGEGGTQGQDYLEQWEEELLQQMREAQP